MLKFSLRELERTWQQESHCLLGPHRLIHATKATYEHDHL